MNLVEEFRSHAHTCRRTAGQTKDPADRAYWEALAARWERCAAVAQTTSEVARERQLQPNAADETAPPGKDFRMKAAEAGDQASLDLITICY
jgi:hypothetical protein